MQSFADSGDFIYSGVLPILTDVMVKFWVMVNICWFIAKSSIVELTLLSGDTIFGFFPTFGKDGCNCQLKVWTINRFMMAAIAANSLDESKICSPKQSAKVLFSLSGDYPRFSWLVHFNIYLQRDCLSLIKSKVYSIRDYPQENVVMVWVFRRILN